MTPEWDASGVLPPIWSGAHGENSQRSPYRISILEFVNRFSGSNKRKSILKGFLDFRAYLYARGINNGFQWVDGSFVENIEMVESRSPRDIDVLTFFFPPNDRTKEEHLDDVKILLDRSVMKKNHKVDSFYLTLGERLEKWQVDSIVYWNSVWSHRRDGTEKGYFEILLSPEEDKLARDALGEVKDEL